MAGHRHFAALALATWIAVGTMEQVSTLSSWCIAKHSALYSYGEHEMNADVHTIALSAYDTAQSKRWQNTEAVSWSHEKQSGSGRDETFMGKVEGTGSWIERSEDSKRKTTGRNRSIEASASTRHRELSRFEHRYIRMSVCKMCSVATSGVYGCLTHVHHLH